MRVSVPDGYAPLEMTSEHVRHVGHFWCRSIGPRLLVGLRVQPHHVNANGTAHGGLIATLADVAIASAIMHDHDLQPPSTIQLSLDFAGPALVGQWLEAQPEIYRRTRRMAFASCMICADDEPVVRASAIFKLQPRR